MPRLLVFTLLTACTSVDQAQDAPTDSAQSTCESLAVLDLINDPATDHAALVAAGVYSRGATNLLAARPLASIEAVDAVSWVGPKSIEGLFAAVDGRCAANVVSCAENQVLAWLNASDTTVEDLKAAGLHTSAAKRLVASRNGADGQPGTHDDATFTSLDDVDAVPYVGPVAMGQLEAVGHELCPAEARAVFSPQNYDVSHLSWVSKALANADESVDVAMYSFSDGRLYDALEEAVDRGVTVRMVFETTNDDRKDPAGTRSARLEDMGIEVRWVNKIMHHKFAIVDGPRHDLARAETGTLITGSGNWSYSAGTRYDENTVFLTADERVNLLYQREFNLLWDNGRDFVWNEDIVTIDHTPITDADIDAAVGSTALFTSANFRTYHSSRYGWTFSAQAGKSAVSDGLVELIRSARSSIVVASGHMRSRAIAQALVDKRRVDPHVDIRVYLDGQEYTSLWYWEQQKAEYEACLADATDAGDRQDCDDAGYHFGYMLHEAGVPVRYKYYAYRWDYTYAAQMHHKYILVDDQTIATGSYNFSPNAEWDTLENVLLLNAADHPELVADYRHNFDTLWATERHSSVYDDLLNQVENGTGDFPIVFDSMALSWDEVEVLKSAIREACPAVNSDAYRKNPGAHTWCER